MSRLNKRCVLMQKNKQLVIYFTKTKNYADSTSYHFGIKTNQSISTNLVTLYGIQELRSFKRDISENVISVFKRSAEKLIKKGEIIDYKVFFNEEYSSEGRLGKSSIDESCEFVRTVTNVPYTKDEIIFFQLMIAELYLG